MSINIPLEMGIEIVTPVNQIYSMIVKAIGFELNARLRKLIPKLETLIGENGVRLSGGEKQRLSIARAILKNSNIILLDEATSSLDSETEEKIQSAINYLTKGKTTVVIAHRLSTVINSNKIYVIEQGKVVATGNHNELLISSNTYKNFYQKQLSKKT